MQNTIARITKLHSKFIPALMDAVMEHVRCRQLHLQPLLAVAKAIATLNHHQDAGVILLAQVMAIAALTLIINNNA